MGQMKTKKEIMAQIADLKVAIRESFSEDEKTAYNQEILTLRWVTGTTKT